MNVAMSKMILFLTLAVLATKGVHGEVDCSNSADGDFEVGCKVFVTCKGGNSTTTECPEGQVYNGAGSCDLIANVPLPCGTKKDCTGLKDGRYADHDYNCQSYYTCMGGKNFGTNNCTPGTVFDDILQICNWPENVPPPCGTLTTTVPTTQNAQLVG